MAFEKLVLGSVFVARGLVGAGDADDPTVDDERPCPCSGVTAPSAHPDQGLLDAALSGDAVALRALLRALQPIVQARVGKALSRWRSPVRGDLRDRALDLVQDVFVALFREDGRALRAWDGSRGLSLANWVGLIAEQRVAAALRRRKAAAVAGDLPLDDAFEASAPAGDDPEASLLARDRLEHVVGILRAELSPLGLSLFQALVVEQEPIVDVAARTGMSISAVQAWSSRLKRRIAGILAELSVDVTPAPSHPGAPGV